MVVHTQSTSTSTSTTLTPTTSNKQIRNEYVTAWLSQQTIDPFDCDDYRDTNQMEDHYIFTVSQQHDQYLLHPGTIASSSHSPYRHLVPQANHSTASTSRTNNLPQGHRRCLSLMNPTTSPVTPTMAISYEEQLQHQLDWHRQNYQLLHATTTPQQYSEAPIHPFIEEPLAYHEPPQRSAEELAWERHNYYLRLQAEEEDLIERLQSDRKQCRGHCTQNKTLTQFWQPRQDPSSSVARTGSLNRLAGPSMLSAETSRVLGLCRTSTLSAVKKIGRAKKDATNRTRRSTRPMSTTTATNNNSTTSSNIVDDNILTQGLGIHSYGRTVTTTSNISAATASSSTFFSFSPKATLSPSVTTPTGGASSPSPIPMKLIKDHFGPSLKSLARRCSTRFSRSSSRPNSYAGPTGDAAADYPLGRRSLGSRPSQQQHKQRGHLYDFKQLPSGPTGGSTEISKLSGRPQEGHPRRSLTTERVPVHRTVTLFRSKSTRAPSSASMMGAKKDDRSSAPITTVLDLPYRPHRNSLRFANGRGLDFSSTPSLTTANSSFTHSVRSSADTKTDTGSNGENKETAAVPVVTGALVEVDSAVVISSAGPTSVLNLEEHESMRQQIVAILSLDRNDMRRRPSSRPKSRSTTPGLSSSSSDHPALLEELQDEQVPQEYLSPLAVEAQEILPADHLKAIQEQEVAAELADPCEHIAFMLVPKSQYEFQPLIAH
ncbi:hypothetical protein EC957_002163 [Mortierella hygrophila]|uniref:Uncharacterized protein n=1 Tax=Mortierella hygrophila TaxID=979708 RepID=A0A9P6K1R9_9FUNG|nr:hypothetical protein EC957_002163 [Mortierella hygrophila]